MNINLVEMFQFNVHPVEIFLRGTVMYLVLFTILRVTLKRVGDSIGLGDILMVALVAAAVQNSIARDNQSLLDGIFLVSTIAFWAYTLDWLGYRFPVFQRFYHPPALMLVRNGRMIRRNMRIELITEDELMTQLHKHGIRNLMEVKEAYVEGDGSITIIKRRVS